MTRELERRFERLERQKAALLSGISIWSTARLRFQPDPASWSVLDVLQHLVKVEEAFLRAVGANLPHGRALTLKDRVGALAVLGVMRSPIRVKVPARAATVAPEATEDLPLLTVHWDQAREKLGQLLNVLSPEQFCRGLFRHPVSGWMSVPQGLAFLSAHLRHHEYQVDRLEKASR